MTVWAVKTCLVNANLITDFTPFLQFVRSQQWNMWRLPCEDSHVKTANMWRLPCEDSQYVKTAMWRQPICEDSHVKTAMWRQPICEDSQLSSSNITAYTVHLHAVRIPPTTSWGWLLNYFHQFCSNSLSGLGNRYGFKARCGKLVVCW